MEAKRGFKEVLTPAPEETNPLICSVEEPNPLAPPPHPTPLTFGFGFKQKFFPKKKSWVGEKADENF